MKYYNTQVYLREYTLLNECLMCGVWRNSGDRLVELQHITNVIQNVSKVVFLHNEKLQA